MGLVYLLFQPGNPTSAKLPREVSVAQAAALQDEGAFIVDVREPSEWEQGYIEGATLISLGQLLQRSGELPAAARRAGTSSKQQDLRRSHPWAAG